MLWKQAADDEIGVYGPMTEEKRRGKLIVHLKHSGIHAIKMAA